MVTLELGLGLGLGLRLGCMLTLEMAAIWLAHRACASRTSASVTGAGAAE